MLSANLNVNLVPRTLKSTPLGAVQQAVEEELQGPGKLLGYRAMHQKIRQIHKLNVPRDLVYDMMSHLDSAGLQERAVGKNQKTKGHFIIGGVNQVHSLDGHDKLMGYQNNTFPLAVYGCLDTASRKILWVKVWTSNHDPLLVARRYLEYLMQNGIIASKLRLDKGTETGIIATMHAYLRRNCDDMKDVECNTVCDKTVIYGPSTSNKVSNFNNIEVTTDL